MILLPFRVAHLSLSYLLREDRLAPASDRVPDDFPGQVNQAIATPCGTNRGCGRCGAPGILPPPLSSPVGVVGE